MRLQAVLLVLLLLPATVSAQSPLDEAQQDWLRDNGPIRIGMPTNVAPASFLDDGKAAGWAAEVAELAALKTGASIEFVYSDVDELWPMLQTGDVDVLGPLGARPELVDNAQPSSPVAWTPIVFVTTEAHPEFVDVASITGKVSTIPGSPMEALLQRDFPHLEYVSSTNPDEGMTLLAAGEVDTYLGPLAVIGYQAQQQGLRNIRPVGDALIVQELTFWSLDDSMALSIVQAGVDRITPSELRVIHVKWTGFDLGKPIEPAASGIPAWVFWAAGAAAIILLLSTLAVEVLRKQVRARTKELRVLNEELEDRVKERTEENLEFRTAIEGANLGFIMGTTRPQVRYNYINARAAQIIENPSWGKLSGILSVDLPTVGGRPLDALIREADRQGESLVFDDVAWNDIVLQIRILPAGESFAVVLVDTTVVAKQRQQLEASNRALEDYAYGVSHDLQTPLRHIQGYAELITIDHDIDDELKHMLERIVGAVGRMDGLISGLLKFSRLTMDDAKMHPVELSAAAHDAAALFTDSPEGTQIIIDELPSVTGDHTHLVSLFQNLIGNAIKYHGDEPPRIHVRTAPEHGPNVVAVEDNGRGFEPQYADRIFQMFRRVHQEDDVEGNGIGLALVSRIMQLHNGRVWAESVAGEGATFFLEFGMA